MTITRTLTHTLTRTSTHTLTHTLAHTSPPQAKALLRELEDISAKVAATAQDHATKSSNLHQRAVKLVRHGLTHWPVGIQPVDSKPYLLATPPVGLLCVPCCVRHHLHYPSNVE